MTTSYVSSPAARVGTSPTGIVLSRARTRRRPAVPPRLGGVLALSVIAVATHLLVATALTRTRRIPLVVTLASRQHDVAVLVSTVLAMTSCLALIALWVCRRANVRTRLLWLALVLAPLVAALDDTVHLYGRATTQLGTWLGAAGVRLPLGPLRTTQAVLMVLTGVVAVVVASIVGTQVLQYRRMFLTACLTGAAWECTLAVPAGLRALSDSISVPLVTQEALRGVAAVLGMLTVLTGLVAARVLDAGRAGLRAAPRAGFGGTLALFGGVLVATAAAGAAVLVTGPAQVQRWTPLLPWVGAVAGGLITGAAALRLTRTREERETRFSEFWADRRAR